MFTTHLLDQLIIPSRACGFKIPDKTTIIRISDQLDFTARYIFTQHIRPCANRVHPDTIFIVFNHFPSRCAKGAIGKNIGEIIIRLGEGKLNGIFVEGFYSLNRCIVIKFSCLVGLLHQRICTKQFIVNKGKRWRMILWIKNTLDRIDIILSDQFPSLAFKCRIIGKVDA